jgi:gliding motility-associated-like protein
MNKQLVLTFLLVLLFAKASSQVVYYSEQTTNRIRTATLTTSGITSPMDLVTGTSAVSIDYDQVNNVLYYLTDGGATLVQANPSDGSVNSIVITEGAMAELVDISFSDNAGQMIFAANGPEVQGMQQIPSNNNDSGTDSRLNLGMSYDNVPIYSLVVDDGSEIIYFAIDNLIVAVDFAGSVLFSIPGFAQPLELAYDNVNNDLYVVNYNGSGYELTSYDLDGVNGYTNYYSSPSPITDVQVYPAFNKAYFAVENTGIYSVVFDIGTVTNEITLTGAGAISFDIRVDQVAPVFTNLLPADGATNVTTINPSFTMTFDENIQRSTTSATGNESTIRLIQLSNGTQTSIIDRTSTGNITIANNVATITFPTTLTTNTDYYILIGNKVFSDAAGNNFSGISLNTGWNVKTVPGVTLNVPTGVACVGTYKNYPAITITESNVGDFKIGTTVTMYFTFSSAGYLYENTTGSITATAGGDITINSFSIGPSQIRITYTITGATTLDAITISGTKLNSSDPANASTTLIRSSGSGMVEGIPLNTAIANINTQAQPPPPNITFNQGDQVCLNDDPTLKTVTSSGTFGRWFTQNNLLPASFITALNDKATVSMSDLGLTTSTPGVLTRYVRQNVGGCISLATQFDFTVNNPPAAIETGSIPQTSCGPPNGSAYVTSVDGAGITGYEFEWLDVNSNVLAPTGASISNVAAGTYFVRAKNSLTGCFSTPVQIDVLENIQYPSISLSSTPNINCSSPNGSLQVTIGSQTGTLTDHAVTWYNGPDNTSPVNPNSTTDILNGLAGGTYTVRVQHIATQCASEQFSVVTDNTTSPQPILPAGDVCETSPGAGTTSVNLTSYNPTITGGDANLSVTWKDGSNNVITSAVVSNNDQYSFELKDNTTSCISTNSLTFTVHSSPTTSAAGPDQVVCGTSATLAGNVPVKGTGIWAITSGAGGTLSTPASATSTFTGVSGTSYVLEWVITNGSVCAVSADQVAITFNALPTIANAGTDKNICGTTTAMTGNTPVAGTGAWSVISGSGGSFSNTASAVSSFTGTAGVSYTLRWTISNATCASSSDDVSVVFVPPPTAAAAGGDQTLCQTSATLAANTPATGSGAWSIINGVGGTINTPSNPASAFSGNADIIYTLRWTITNGICPASTDDVTIALTNPVTTAQAGPDQASCVSVTTLVGNTPSSGSGMWTIISGTGGSVASPTSPSSSFVGVAGNQYVLRWTISKNGCTPSLDEVAVVMKSAPSGTGTITPSDDLCAGESATLSVTGFSNATTFAWSIPQGFDFNSTTQPSIDITATSGSGGNVTVTPENECGNGTPASVSIGINPTPSIEIQLPPPAYAHVPVIFSFSSDQTLSSSAWALGDGTASADQSVEHAFDAPGNFEISLTVTSAAGCINTAVKTFTVPGEPELTDRAIKNVITANGDDKNNVLYIDNLDRYPENEVRFLDRWGVEIFSTTNYQNDWEARAKDGQFLPAGQYICIVKLQSTGKVISRTVSIIKGR